MATNLITDKLAGWTPSPEAQSMIFWRILQLFMARYGSVPLGQLLVGMTATVLNELGRSPTVTELCEATGLPKSSISRYISSQMEQGVVQETIDPQDRRRRMLTQTDVGRAERQWQTTEMRRILEEVRAWDEARTEQEVGHNPATELEAMKQVIQNSPGEFQGRRKRGRRNAA
ncbi:MAG: MarR family winged helix-turn-helix transcriptional regulator [Gammaproteobacteria bacterium]|nr:MarR family winged helix-turn-helix transcriptional regulator [Gammaproteobacteria bacterium]